jgi:DNA-binding transcriptional ArsR family regulator
MKTSRLIERLLKQESPTWEQYNELERAGALTAYFKAYMAKEDGAVDFARQKVINRVSKEMAECIRRETYEVNHGNIKAAILNHLADKKNMPTVEKIAKAAGLSRQTVTKHLKDFDMSAYFPDECRKYQIAFMGIMDALLSKCMSGDVKAMRLYFEIMAFSSKRNPQAGFLLDRPQAEQPDSSPAEGEGPQLAYTSKANGAAIL